MPAPPKRPSSPRIAKKIFKIMGLAWVSAALLAALGWLWIVSEPYPVERLSRENRGSTQIVDRHGEPLRDALDEREGRSDWVELDAVSPWLVAATLAGEDHRFEDHAGVDPWAVARAIKANLSEGRVYSGASTLTMQLVRMVDADDADDAIDAIDAIDADRRSGASPLVVKLRQAVDALRLERAMSKEEILTQYLNRAPYGNGTHGVEAASRLYFGRSAADLSLAEAALLAALPRSPSGYDPYRHLDRATRRQRHILNLMRSRSAASDAVGVAPTPVASNAAGASPSTPAASGSVGASPPTSGAVGVELPTPASGVVGIGSTPAASNAARIASTPADAGVVGIGSTPASGGSLAGRSLVRSVDAATHARALAQPIALLPRRAPFRAPHFVDAVIERHGAALDRHPARLTTSLSLPLQLEVEAAVARHMRRLADQGPAQAAVVVVDNASGEVLSMVGSRDWADEAAQGQVNGALAPRQPGSTLKPFAFALAFERHLATPATVLADVPTHFVLGPGQTYTPQNFDLRFRGPVRARDALAGSLNVPAVRLLQELGPPAFLEQLHTFGFDSLDEPAGHYGLGLVLGDGEVTLMELVGAYAALARGGSWRPLSLLRGGAGQEGRRVCSPEVAHLIADILSDDLARMAAFGPNTPFSFPYPVAVKTGTSAGARDVWSVGFTAQVTVGVWVGRFDGGRLPGLSGVVGAGPLFREVMELSMRGRPAQAFVQPGSLERVEICALSGHRAGPDCPHRTHEVFVQGQAPEGACAWHRLVALDRRNGLLAGPDCPERHTRAQVFVDLPEDPYADWARAHGVERPPAAFSPLCPAREQRAPELQIMAPQDGEVFLLNPSRPLEYQTLRLVAQTTRPALLPGLRWTLDDQPLDVVALGPRGAQGEARWTPRPGVHRLQAALGDGIVSQTIEITVK